MTNIIRKDNDHLFDLITTSMDFDENASTCCVEPVKLPTKEKLVEILAELKDEMNMNARFRMAPFIGLKHMKLLPAIMHFS